MLNKTPSGPFTAVGRRKTASARARLTASKGGEITVNSQPIDKYFSDPSAQSLYTEVFKTTNTTGQFAVSVKVEGSGKQGQLGATILAIARALCQFNPELKSTLRKHGFMTRDPRARQREKFGLMGARKQKQSPKR